MNGQNLGKGASILRQHFADVMAMHDEVDAWHAPSECHKDVERGALRQFRTVRRHIKAVTGLKFRVFEKELERRTSARWVHFNLGGPVS